jgi:hypothetical protein
MPMLNTKGKLMKRPTVTDEIVREAVKTTLRNVDDDEVDAIVKIYSHPMDGYKIARALEDEIGDDYTIEDAIDFDVIGDQVSRLLYCLEDLWVKENNIQPPFPNGTKIMQGVIHDVSMHHHATYRVAEHQNLIPNSFLLVKFENAVAV